MLIQIPIFLFFATKTLSPYISKKTRPSHQLLSNFASIKAQNRIFSSYQSYLQWIIRFFVFSDFLRILRLFCPFQANPTKKNTFLKFLFTISSINPTSTKLDCIFFFQRNKSAKSRKRKIKQRIISTNQKKHKIKLPSAIFITNGSLIISCKDFA